MTQDSPTALHHVADCAGARMDQSVRDVPEEEVRVTTWRCLDCGAFATHEEPMKATPGGADASIGE